jgi:hypothetical protein
LDQTRPGGDVAAGEQPFAVDARTPNFDPLKRLTRLSGVGVGSLKTRSSAT